MTQIINIFSKKTDGKTRYWASVGGEDADGGPISATIFVRMSNRARNVFENGAIPTKNKKIIGGSFEVKDCWLKAVPGEEYNHVLLFINKLDVYDPDGDLEDEDEEVPKKSKRPSQKKVDD